MASVNIRLLLVISVVFIGLLLPKQVVESSSGVTGGSSLRWMSPVKTLSSGTAALTCDLNDVVESVKIGEKKKMRIAVKLEGNIVNDSRTETQFSCLNCQGSASLTKEDNRTAILEWDTTNVDLTQFVISRRAAFHISAKATMPAGGLGDIIQETFGAACVRIVGLCDKPDQNSCVEASGSGCVWLPTGRCVANDDTSVKCPDIGPEGVCKSMLHCRFDEGSKMCLGKNQVEVDKAIDKYIAERYGMPKGYTGPLPECAFKGSCRNVEDLVQLGVNVANWLFGIIAGLGFAFFVYGGLTMVLSFGNSEKVGQGKQILVAATVGMIIAFSAYILVSFIVKAIGITP